MYTYIETLYKSMNMFVCIANHIANIKTINNKKTNKLHVLFTKQ